MNTALGIEQAAHADILKAIECSFQGALELLNRPSPMDPAPGWVGDQPSCRETVVSPAQLPRVVVNPEALECFVISQQQISLAFPSLFGSDSQSEELCDIGNAGAYAPELPINANGFLAPVRAVQKIPEMDVAVPDRLWCRMQHLQKVTIVGDQFLTGFPVLAAHAVCMLVQHCLDVGCEAVGVSVQMLVSERLANAPAKPRIFPPGSVQLGKQVDNSNAIRRTPGPRSREVSKREIFQNEVIVDTLPGIGSTEERGNAYTGSGRGNSSIEKDFLLGAFSCVA
ncbi:hypothetical protein [Streptomyces sp. DG1A-41]|uniref:hypothetical protein n=1 Tax=Streptomyces sp. DG1A-41 TaxID=3125779 RepID=UPI0030CE3832